VDIRGNGDGSKVNEPYHQFFNSAFGWDPDNEMRGPYPYQERLALEPWPDLLHIPTGLGKTAAVILAWLWKRGWRPAESRNTMDAVDAETPRRLVYCLPMRVLVEQTTENVRRWLERLGVGGEAGQGRVSVHLLMGGEEDLKSWTEHPEEDMIIVGTQDMLLSRALMRGYGMSRYQWPVHFALLHNDAFWVYDEVQLMGPALTTSAQLEGFRRSAGTEPALPTRSLWLSATLNADWLDTVDLRPYRGRLVGMELGEEEKQTPAVRQRREATKTLRRAETTLTSDHTNKQGLLDYADSLAQEVLQEHNETGDTLVVVNTVDRAQALYDALQKQDEDEVLLVHARFRPAERRSIERRLQGAEARARIIVATQAIEAGVDLTSCRLFTELAPWSSLVQRFGRCNRYGESEEAIVFWIDVEANEKPALPYEADALESARGRLELLPSASAADLPPTDEAAPLNPVLRRRDLLDLFNNEPDLSGFDIDISPYIRDTGSPQVHVFWRTFADEPDDETKPESEELCPVSLTQLRDHLSKRLTAYTWDALTGDWRPMRQQNQIIPGATVLLRSTDGGYLADRGFSPGSKPTVEPVGQSQKAETAYDDDPNSMIGRFVELTEHLIDVAEEADRLCRALAVSEDDAAAVITAGHRHDVGKAHPAFQTALKEQHEPPQDGDALWAKSPGKGRLDYRIAQADGDIARRPRFRHELASMLAWLEHGEPGADHDLIAYLIAAHHGKVRMGLRALPEEEEPPDGRRFARGVWEGDRLPAVLLNGITLPRTALRLSVMELGWGEQGPSWTERTQRMLGQRGPFCLAWLETLVRIADWRASAREREETP